MDAIVVGTDGSEGGMAAVVKAGRLAAATGARVVVVSAYANNGGSVIAPEAAGVLAAAGVDGEDRATEALRKAAQRLEAEGVAHETRAVHAAAADALCEVAEIEKAQTIVVGSRGMRGARRILGSVPNAVTHRSPCDVLVVRTD